MTALTLLYAAQETLHNQHLRNPGALGKPQAPFREWVCHAGKPYLEKENPELCQHTYYKCMRQLQPCT